MSRKKKKLRFYNKNPEADYQARAMQKLIELTMPKEEVKKLLLEASTANIGYNRFMQPKREPFKINIRCPKCTLDLVVMQSELKDGDNINCPICMEHLHFSIGKNGNGDTITVVTCGSLVMPSPSLEVLNERTFRGI